MKIVEINATAKGSTGNIMLNIAKMARSEGNEVYTFSEKKRGAVKSENHFLFGNRFENLIHRACSQLTGISGTGSKIGTRKLLKEIKEISPDIIHLHNLHGWYINIPMLFDFIRENNIKTVWTLHDCWAITAQCSHFTVEKCDKWKTGCYSCPRYKMYPGTYVDKTKKMWKLKKQWFSQIQNLTIVTPSVWLANLVKQSYLKEYQVKVINNGINLEIFKPTQSDFRQKYNLQDKKIILGVASSWGERKGIGVFIKLAKELSDEYLIVLVGTNEDIDKMLPKKILSIHKTENQVELAQIYTAADVFVNATLEENFPTVNLEALACGTPVVTFNTGGSGESVTKEVGTAVEYNNVSALKEAIISVCENNSFSAENCVLRAKEFCVDNKFKEYLQLYK